MRTTIRRLYQLLAALYVDWQEYMTVLVADSYQMIHLSWNQLGNFYWELYFLWDFTVLYPLIFAFWKGATTVEHLKKGLGKEISNYIPYVNCIHDYAHNIISNTITKLVTCTFGVLLHVHSEINLSKEKINIWYCKKHLKNTLKSVNNVHNFLTAYIYELLEEMFFCAKLSILFSVLTRPTMMKKGRKYGWVIY